MTQLLLKIMDMGGGSPTWTVRRRWQFLINVYCMGVIVWAAGWIEREAIATLVISSAFGVLAATNAWYVSNSTYEDVKKKETP